MQIKIEQMQIQKDKYNHTHAKHVTKKISQTLIQIQKDKYTDTQVDIKQVKDKIWQMQMQIVELMIKILNNNYKCLQTISALAAMIRYNKIKKLLFSKIK